MSLFVIITIISFFMTVLCILFVFGKKPALEHKYTLTIAYLNAVLSLSCSFCASSYPALAMLGTKISYSVVLMLMLLLLQLDSLLFNIRISRRIFCVIVVIMMTLVLCGTIPYDGFGFSTKVFAVVMAVHFIAALSLLAFTISVFIFRLIVSSKKGKIFYTGNFVVCIFPIVSFSLMSLNSVLFYGPLCTVTLFTVFMTFMLHRDRFSNLRDMSFSIVENAVSGPCLVLDDRLMVHSANLSAVELFPEYRPLLKTLKRPLKANDILTRIVFHDNNEHRVGNGTFEIEGKWYKGICFSIKNDYHFYGYTVVLKDITEQNDIVFRLENKTEQQKQLLKYYENEIATIHGKFISGAIQQVLSMDRETGEHIRRVSNYTNIIARQLLAEGKFRDTLSDRYVDVLTRVSPLLDIGKINLNRDFSRASSIHTLVSDAEIQRHVTNGAELIDSFAINNPDDLFYRLAREVVMYHHEWWNGEGYLKGLKGYEIPLSARIVAVADTFDTVSFRQYKESNAKDFKGAVSAVMSYSGKRFDPDVMDAFKNASDKIKALYNELVVSDMSYNGRWGGV